MSSLRLNDKPNSHDRGIFETRSADADLREYLYCCSGTRMWASALRFFHVSVWR